MRDLICDVISNCR